MAALEDAGMDDDDASELDGADEEARAPEEDVSGMDVPADEASDVADEEASVLEGEPPEDGTISDEDDDGRPLPDPADTLELADSEEEGAALEACPPEEDDAPCEVADMLDVAADAGPLEEAETCGHWQSSYMLPSSLHCCAPLAPPTHAQVTCAPGVHTFSFGQPARMRTQHNEAPRAREPSKWIRMETV